MITLQVQLRPPVGITRVGAIQLVVEPAVHPGFAGAVVVARLDGLAEHVRVVAARPVDLLDDPPVDAIHQLPVTPAPTRRRAARRCPARDRW